MPRKDTKYAALERAHLRKLGLAKLRTPQRCKECGRKIILKSKVSGVCFGCVTEQKRQAMKGGA